MTNKSVLQARRLCTMIVLFSACAAPIGSGSRELAHRDNSDANLRTALPVEICIRAMENNDDQPTSGLNPSSIKVLSWNVNKGRRADWKVDWDRLSNDIHLALIQEATLDMALGNSDSALKFASFSPGFATKKLNSGVLTLSSHEPLTQCHLQHIEPWLRTPKAVAVTELPVLGSDLSLLVVNLHGINFSFGVVEFSKQLRDIGEILAAHRGPILFAGDFNAWRQRRVDIVENLVEYLGMDTVRFAKDYRRTINGRPFSLFFTRFLKIKESKTWRVDSSDHNPVFVELAIDSSDQ